MPPLPELRTVTSACKVALPMRLPQLTVSTLEILLWVGIIGSQWDGAFTASGHGRVPRPMYGVALGVAFPPARVVPCAVGVALAPLLPPLQAASASEIVKRSTALRSRYLARAESFCHIFRVLQGSSGKKDKGVFLTYVCTGT